MSTSLSRIGCRHVPIGAALLAIFAAAAVRGQQPNAQQNAPIDLTGYWVSVVTEDWRWRMITPPPGDYASMPMTPAAREVADRWDREADARDGNACRPYGAGGIMRLPTRLRISWFDPETLQVETDAGSQTRIFHFGEFEPIPEPDWQGNSVAEWELVGGRGSVAGGNLKVVTTGFRAGYLRWNGVPYSADALRTYFLSSHYRSPLQYSDEGSAAMERSMDRFRHALRPPSEEEAANQDAEPLDADPYRERFMGAMDDDLNTPQAIAALFDLARDINREREAGRSVKAAQSRLREMGGILGLTFEEPAAGNDEVAAKPFIDLLVSTRTDLRQARQFELADRIRDQLAAQGVVLEDSAQGTTWRYQRSA